MTLTKQLILLPAFLFMMVYAYAQDIHYNYDRGANFAAYETYQWVDIPGDAVPDQLIDRDIKQAVDEQLAQKGLTRVEKDADLYVGYHALIKEEKRVDMWGTSSGPLGWGGGWGGMNSAHGQTSTISVGMLLVDIYDPGRKQLVWRGDATNTIDLKKDPNKNYRNLQKAMAKLFKNYPPRTNK
jgi:Domain of unknown function (DUF4136)